jgi:hypothetical protein
MTPDLASTPRPPLGRRLFEEEPAWTVLPTVLMVSGSLLLVLLAVAVQREGLRMPQMELGGLAIALIALGVHLQYVRVTIHENGVLRRTVVGRRGAALLGRRRGSAVGIQDPAPARRRGQAVQPSYEP